tara:strand:+ start:948 stop:2426 length:1479 start_codon:yes stop_codon:yes gene_type:complete
MHEDLKKYLNELLQKGSQFLELNRNLEAKESFQNILKHQPNHPHTLNLLGITFVKLKKIDDAIVYFELAIKSDKLQEGFYVNLGNAYEKINNFDKALNVYQNGLVIKSDSSILFNQIGLLFFNQNNYYKASFYFKKSFEADPKNKFTINNLGLVDFELSNFKNAISHFNSAISLDNKFLVAHFNLGIILLLQNDLLNGWKKYEYRSYKNKYPEIKNNKPEWNGSDLTNKTLLIICEQGIGDSVQFVRYISLIKKSNTKIILLVRKNFINFFKNLKSVDMMVDAYDDLPKFDQYIFLMSLPNIFKNIKYTPKPINFFNKKNNINIKWKNIFKTYNNYKLKVGLVWQGDHLNNKNDSKRSIPLNKLEPILRLNKIKFFSLQKYFGKEQIEAYNFGKLIINFYDNIDVEPFEDTLSIIENLDLVISVDTSLAHISATAGKKTWIMIPKVPDFRWGLNKPSSIWYDNITLYRQKEIHEWDSVVTDIISDLNFMLNE